MPIHIIIDTCCAKHTLATEAYIQTENQSFVQSLAPRGRRMDGPLVSRASHQREEGERLVIDAKLPRHGIYVNPIVVKRMQ